MAKKKPKSFIMAEEINGESVSYDYPGQREGLRVAHQIRMKRDQLRKKRKKKRKK